MRFVLILYLLIFTTNSVNASSLESARCSAIFYIMTAVGHVEPNLGKYFTQQGGLSSMMTGIYLGDETNKPVTNGDVNALKSEQIIWIGNQYPSKKTFIQNKIRFREYNSKYPEDQTDRSIDGQFFYSSVTTTSKSTFFFKIIKS